MLDEQSGKAYSLIVLEAKRAAPESEALAQRPADRRVGVDPDHVQFVTATAF